MIRRRFFGLLCVMVTLVGIFAGFRGPYAFTRRPTLILAPLYAPDLSVDEIAGIRLTLEREIAAEGSHALYPKSLIENFYLERDNRVDVFDGEYLGKDEAFALGEGLGVERVAIATVLRYYRRLQLSLVIHDIKTDQVVGKVSFDTPDSETLQAWKGMEGQRLDLATELGITVPGMSFGALVYLGWLGAFGLIGVLLLFALPIPRLFIETLLGLGLLLGLFAWAYALNGDMDYVQRFVATSGVLHLDDTRAERNATLFRYALPMLLLVTLWISDVRRRLKSGHADFLDATAPLWSILSALLYSLALPNLLVLHGIPLLAWVATAPLYIVLRRVRYGRGFALVLLFIGLQTLLVNWWQGTFSYVSLPFTLGLTLMKALPFVALLVFTVRHWPRWGLWAAPLLWTGFDWILSLGFLGYPWGLLGVSQYSIPALIQIAAVGGVWMVSFFTHLSGAVVAFAAEGLIRARGTPHLRLSRRIGEIRIPRTAWMPLVGMLILIGLLATGGGIALALRDAMPEGRLVRILLVQQNTDPRKHDYHLSFDELSRLTEEAVATDGPFDLIAWPESGFVPDVRFWLDESRVRWRRGKLVRQFLDWQSEMGIPLLTGNQDHFYETAAPDAPGDNTETPDQVKHIQNSALYLPPSRSGDADRYYYYKIRLVPFTENFPYREEYPWVADLLHNFSTTQWTPGNEYTVLEAPDFRFSAPICFEDVFPDHVRRFVAAGAEVLVNISNDYWANTPLEGYQHGAHAVFRAVENRRPLVRATCSGWTISVDTEGRIAVGWPEFYQPGTTVAEHRIPDAPRTTLYTRFGDWFPVLLLALWAIFLIVEQLQRRRSEGRTARYSTSMDGNRKERDFS